MLHTSVEEALAKWVAASAVPNDRHPSDRKVDPGRDDDDPLAQGDSGEREGIGAKSAYLVPADHTGLQGRIREEEGEGRDPSRKGTDIAPAQARAISSENDHAGLSSLRPGRVSLGRS